MPENVLPPLPKRRPDRLTVLTGREVARALEIMGVSRAQVARLTGKTLARVDSQLDSEGADSLPLYFDILLYALYHRPELRAIQGPIPLPFEAWGIDGSERPRGRNACIRGHELGNILQSMNVSRGRFSLLTGSKRDRLSKQINKDECSLPLFYEIALYVLHHCPELQTIQGPIPLPFEEWGMDLRNEYEFEDEG